MRSSSLCVQWQAHRHAGAYRLLLESLPSECAWGGGGARSLRRRLPAAVPPPDGAQQETRLSGAASRHCFNNLKADTQYKVSVHAVLPDGFEGPAVTVTETTREFSR